MVPKDSGLEHYIGLEHLDPCSLKIRRFGEPSSLIGDKLKIYKNEMGNHPFPRSERNLRALATYRGATSRCNYAESFMLLKEVK